MITAAAWAGHTLGDVLRRLHSGAWPGLASLYAPGTRTAAVRADWRKAHQLIAARTAAPAGLAKNHPSESVHQSPISELTSHGGTYPVVRSEMIFRPRRSTGGSAPGGTS